MTASQMRIAETIDAFYGDAGANDGVSRSYKQAVEDLDAETIKALDGPYRLDCRSSSALSLLPLPPRASVLTALITHPPGAFRRQTVLEPISRFCAYFPDINECTTPPPPPFFFFLSLSLSFPSFFSSSSLTTINPSLKTSLPPGIKKRNHKLLDYDATRARVKKLVEKPDKDPTKLPRAERDSELARAAYETLNEQLFTELPQLIDLRVPYLDPSFEALVKIQLRFCAEAYSRMAQVQQFLDADTREQYAQGHLDTKVEQVLAEIRELSISGTV